MNNKVLVLEEISWLRKAGGDRESQRCLLLELHQQKQHNFRETLSPPLATVSTPEHYELLQSLRMWFISGWSSHKCLFMNYEQIQGKLVQEKLCSRLESAQKYLCVRHEQIRINFFSCISEGVKCRRWKASSTRT